MQSGNNGASCRGNARSPECADGRFSALCSAIGGMVVGYTDRVEACVFQMRCVSLRCHEFVTPAPSCFAFVRRAVVRERAFEIAEGNISGTQTVLHGIEDV